MLNLYVFKCNINSDKNGKVIKGVKAHKYRKEIHLMGLLLRKETLRKGIYSSKEGKEAALKRRILSGTPLANIRQFKLVEGRFNSITIGKINIQDIALAKSLS